MTDVTFDDVKREIFDFQRSCSMMDTMENFTRYVKSIPVSDMVDMEEVSFNRLSIMPKRMTIFLLPYVRLVESHLNVLTIEVLTQTLPCIDCISRCQP